MGLKKINKSDILKIYKREQSYLLESVKKAKNPYHIFSLSTINNHHPESRIVVLRNVQINPLKLFRFHKIDYLKAILNSPRSIFKALIFKVKP